MRRLDLALYSHGKNKRHGAHAEDFVELISEMEKSRTVNISHHSDDPNVGLGSTEDLMQYKMFVGDTGLFVTLAFRDKAFTENSPQALERLIIGNNLARNQCECKKSIK